MTQADPSQRCVDDPTPGQHGPAESTPEHEREVAEHEREVAGHEREVAGHEREVAQIAAEVAQTAVLIAGSAVVLLDPAASGGDPDQRRRCLIGVGPRSCG